jgi:hypothetical protein
MLISLLITLTACSAPKRIKAEVGERSRPTPPIALMQDCHAPNRPLDRTVRAQLEYIPIVLEALGACNVDKEKLREWATGSTRVQGDQ